MVIFDIITASGDAMNLVMEALDLIADKDINLAKEKLISSKEYILKAHKRQTELIVKAANGEPQPMSILMVHAQDHLMNVMLASQMADKIIKIFDKWGLDS